MNRLTLIKTCLFAMLLGISGVLYAQAPPPPPPSGQGTDQPAPLGSGLAILSALALAYGGKKLYRAHKKYRKPLS